MSGDGSHRGTGRLAEGNRFALCPLTYLYAPYAAHGYRTHPIAFHDMPTLGPSGPLGSALGGTGIAISSRTAHPELCSAFALWVASDTVQRGLYAQNNGQPGNAVAWGDTDVNAAVGNAYANTRMTHEAACCARATPDTWAFRRTDHTSCLMRSPEKQPPIPRLMPFKPALMKAFRHDRRPPP